MLTLREVARLPLHAELRDGSGAVLASTPEWAGEHVGAVAYRHGDLSLVVAARDALGSLPRDRGADAAGWLAGRIVAAAEALGDRVSPVEASRLAVLTTGLRVVSGRPLTGVAPAAAVVEMLAHCVPARSEVTLRPPLRIADDALVHAPAAVAGALLQIVVNAGVHAGAGVVDLDVVRAIGAGVTFRLQWDGAPPPEPVTTSRSTAGAVRTGLMTARLLADAAGAVLTGVLPGVDGDRLLRSRSRVELTAGDATLRLPIARIERGHVVWSTGAFREEAAAVGARGTAWLDALCGRAARLGGAVAAVEGWTARAAEGATWVAQPPATTLERARLAARVLAHERALLAVAGDAGDRLRALCQLFDAALGGELPTTSVDRWNAALQARADVEAVLTPLVTAALGAELAASLELAGGVPVLRLAPGATSHPLARWLSEDGRTIALSSPPRSVAR